MAAKNSVPVLPCFITMKDSDTLDPDGFPVQEYTVHVLPAIYPDKDKSVRENTEIMLNKNYETWKDLYENVYGEDLVYLTSNGQKPTSL